MNKPDFSYNFFHVDDWLIRVGIIWFVVMLILLLNDRMPFGFDSAFAYALLIPPVVIFLIGHRVRQVEKRTLSVWRILYSNTSIKVAELVANSDITRPQIFSAVKLLNNRGLGFYVWNKNTDTITDGRLDDDYVMVEACESCAAPVGLRVSLAGSEVPS